MGYIANNKTPQEVKNFFTNVKNAFNQKNQYAILTFDKEELNVHCFIDSGPLNVWINILNYAEI